MSSERIMNLLVTIPAESRRMNVGKDVIRILGSPAYICILQRKDRQSIAITPCAAEHPMSFKVPDRLLTDGQCRMRINGVQFVQALLEANGLAAGKDYQFKGRYEAEKNAVIISLEKDEQGALSPQKVYNLTSRPFGRIIRPNGRDGGANTMSAGILDGFQTIIPTAAAVLSEKRQILRLTQQEVANRAKITLRQYQRLESGERNILTSSFGLACRVIEALDMDVSKFYHGDYYLEEEVKTMRGKGIASRKKSSI